MHVQEKQAWYMLIVAMATLAIVLLLVAIYGFHPTIYGAYGILALWGFTPVIGQRRRNAGEVVMDERNQQIALSATTGAYSVFWVLFVFTAMGPFFVLGPCATITLRTIAFSNLVCAAAFVFWMVRSLIVVVLYRRGRS